MDPGETQFLELLATYGLRAERPSKVERRAGKTPDYRVFEGTEFRFFCELKGVIGDGWLGRQVASVPAGTIVGGARPDPAFNRLSDDIHSAVKQLDAVNADRRAPNVLAFVNYEPLSGMADLMGVLTGNLYADDGSRLPIYRQYSEGRIRDDKKRVDLYLWIDEHGEPRFVFTEDIPQHRDALCRCFRTSPEQLAR